MTATSFAGKGRDLFDHWPSRQLRHAKRISLFLDFDGTLAPIHHRPGEVSLDPSTREALRKLARHPRIGIWILSGRRRGDVRSRTGVRGIRYLGLHGWEGLADSSLPVSARRLSREARTLFARSLAGIQDVWIENKGPVFVIHYRGAGTADARRARARVRSLMKRFEPDLRMMPGKKIWEVLPREIGSKADAVRAIVAKQPAGSVVIVAGDDTTDEEAFRALRGAITVRVGPNRQTCARFRLGNSNAVRQFLQKLESEITQRGRAATW